MDLIYKPGHRTINLSNPGVIRGNRPPSKCFRCRSKRPSASGSSDGNSNSTKEKRHSGSKLNRLIPALLEERKGFGVLLTVTLTTVSRVAKRYISTLLEQGEANSKTQTSTVQDETGQTSDPSQIQPKLAAYEISNEEKDRDFNPESVSIEQEPSSYGQAFEGDRDSRQASGLTDKPDATSSENEAGSNLQMDRDVKKAMLHGRHISLLTSPFSAEEVQRMGSGFSREKQATRTLQQIVQSDSSKGKQTKSISINKAMGGDYIGDGGDNDGGGGRGDGDGNSNGGGDENDGRLFFSLIMVLAALIALFGFGTKRLDFNGFFESINRRNESS